jgi:glycerol 3-phosphatase-2
MAIVDHFNGFLIDLDGVVYVGETLVPEADDAVRALRAMDKNLLFLTNDPRSSREEYAVKLRRLGVDVQASEILTSAAATAACMAREEPANRSVFVVGAPALKGEIQSVGFTVLEGEQGSDADLVVVGGHDAFCYEELRIASLAVRRGAGFYATGRDPTFPMPDGPWPATGAILAAVETAAGRPAHVVGKPDPDMFRVAQDLLRGIRRCAVIGDRLDSDIAGGHRAGLATVLVLSGSTNEGEAREASPPPDFVVRSLSSLVRGM